MGQEVKDLTVHAAGPQEGSPSHRPRLDRARARVPRRPSSTARRSIKALALSEESLLPRLGHAQGQRACQGDLPAPRRLNRTRTHRTAATWS
ncbi:MAG: hypothetical protein MZV63_41290 [Marinilabiliales bacterium]|nr:hypothetical protein [Marinilabiliales bacterium]